jgi:hypothetical protein
MAQFEYFVGVDIASAFFHGVCGYNAVETGREACGS